MAIRKSERQRLRRELITRTARVWTKLNKILVEDLNKSIQKWIEGFCEEKFPEKFGKVL